MSFWKADEIASEIQKIQTYLVNWKPRDGPWKIWKLRKKNWYSAHRSGMIHLKQSFLKSLCISKLLIFQALSDGLIKIVYYPRSLTKHRIFKQTLHTTHCINKNIQISQISLYFSLDIQNEWDYFSRRTELT